MNDKDRDTLRHHWRSLRRDLEPIKLFPYLVDVLDVTDEEKVKAQSIRADKVDKLLEILPRKGPKAFDVFVNALQEVQPFLASLLLQESEESGRNEERLTKIEEVAGRNEVPSAILDRGHLAFKAYNNALVDGKACIKRVPIMIIGQDRTGKTSLKKSLKGEKFNDNEHSTEGIETDLSYFNISTEIWRARKKEKIEEEDEIYSILWDFGGQSVYYATHPIFLTEAAIYILACDLSRNPHEKADTPVRKGLYKNKEDICCNKTNLDYLDFWMSSVYSLVCSDTSPSDTSPARLPPVFLVCTHADKPYRCTVPRELALVIFEALRAKAYKRHLFDDVFVVDNTKSGSRNECPEVVRLREKVLTVAQQLPQMKEAIPVKWLQYENKLQLLREEDKKWISISEAKQIASDKCGIVDDEQFQTCLDFLHDQRVVIHYKATNMVIVDPQWLIDVFKKVITIKQYEHTQGPVEELWVKLETTGILDERLLDHQWKPLFDMYSEETRTNLIAIMGRFSLLCSWPSDGANKQYLVPSMLVSPPTDDVKEILASVRIPSLFVRFESGRVPPGLFSRLVLQFYQWSNEEWKSQITPELFNNFAQFYIRPDQGTSVIFLCHSSSIEIALHDRSNSLDAEVAGYPTSQGIHRQLRMMLECMRKDFGWLKNMRYEMCVCCPVCPKKGSVICRTHDVRACECLHLLPESELQNCQYCTKRGLYVDRIISIKMFAPWFTFSGSQDGRILTNRQAATGSDVKERSSVSCKEGESLALPDSVLQTIQSQSSDCKDIVVRFQECLQLTDPAALENPEPETKRWIRCLANTAKSQNRMDLVEYLRMITPAGTTGPLLDEKLDVRCIPPRLRKELTFSFSGGDEWKLFAQELGMSYNEIRFLDKRTTNPCDVVIDLMANHRFMSVGEVYDQLVKSGLPGLADLL